MKNSIFPGILLLIAIGVFCNWCSELVVMGGKHPLEASALAVVIGILIRNLSGVPKAFKEGVDSSEKLLILGIVLMGAGLDFRSLISQGPALLGVIVVTMVSAFFLILYLGKLFKLPPKLAILLSVGTTICGTSAIAITAPLIKAKEEETSYAVGTIALWGLIAILLYPALGRLVNASDFIFGVFAGTAIHSTPQVVGAGFIFSEIAGKTATAVKLIRNCFMAPLAIAVATWEAKKNNTESSHVNLARAFPWFLFGYFLMSACNSWGYFTSEGITAFSNAGKFLILLGMAGIGLSTSFSSFKSVGLRPLVVGFLGALVLAFVSILSIKLLLPNG